MELYKKYVDPEHKNKWITTSNEKPTLDVNRYKSTLEKPENQGKSISVCNTTVGKFEHAIIKRKPTSKARIY